MHLYLLFDRCCAYCRTVIDGQPEPDHVVALSRGGSNSITNILPSCHGCNSAKRDRTLDEWAAERRRNGKLPVVTTWSAYDVRYRHLTSVIGSRTAA